MSARIIKICGITTLEDAMAAVKGGATAIGFNFYPRSKRYIRPESAGRIGRALPPSVTKVGVFVNEAPDDVERLAREGGVEVAQLHGDERPGQQPQGLRVWKAFRVEADFDMAVLALWDVEAFLLDGPAGAEYGGGGKPFTWSAAAGLGRRVIIAGGLDETNVAAAMAQAKPWGVDACSRIELTPGRKDRRKMAEFLKRAAVASRQLGDPE